MPTKKLAIWLILTLSLLTVAVAGARAGDALAAPAAQAATSTLPANRVEVFQDVNVRAGPGTDYDQVGVLISGQTSPIIGRSSEGTWFEIEYVGGPDNTGWVFRDLVHVVGDLNTMPTIVPPPTPTLRPTTTAVPGAAQGPTPIVTGSPPADRLATFTPPAAVALPTLLPAQGISSGGSFPPAVLIIVLLVLGTFGGLLSLLRLRK
jgi:uncharacterized protein YraI